MIRYYFSLSLKIYAWIWNTFRLLIYMYYILNYTFWDDKNMVHNFFHSTAIISYFIFNSFPWFSLSLLRLNVPKKRTYIHVYAWCLWDLFVYRNHIMWQSSSNLLLYLLFRVFDEILRSYLPLFKRTYTLRLLIIFINVYQVKHDYKW